MDNETKLREIQTRLSQATAKKARAQVLVETAETNLRAARDKIKADFGVSTAEEIAAKLKEFQEELEKELELAQQAFDNSKDN